jgi:hypothetical protein
MAESDREPTTPESEATEPLSAPESPSEPPLSAESVVVATDAPPEAQLDSEQIKPISRRESELIQRLEALTAAIAAAPDDPINYVLRGEVRLKLGDQENAAEDFRRGLLLIAAIGETDWGYIHTALAERAQEGLRHCL